MIAFFSLLLSPATARPGAAFTEEHGSVHGPTVDLQIMNLEIVDGKLRERKVDPNPDVRSMGDWTSLEFQESFRRKWAVVWPKRRTARDGSALPK